MEDRAIIEAIRVISNQNIEYISTLYVDDSFAFDFIHDVNPVPPALPPPVSMTQGSITQGLGSEIITFITSLSLPSTAPASPIEESFESVD